MNLLFLTEEAAWTASAKIAQNLGMSGDTLYFTNPEYVESLGKWRIAGVEPLAKPLPPVYNEETGQWEYNYEIIDPMVGVVGYEIEPDPVPGGPGV